MILTFQRTAFLLMAVTAAGATYSQAPPPSPRLAADARLNAPHPPPPEQALTADQAARVKAVLAKYKANSLTVEDAKLIKRSLRDAGLRRSQALDDALKAAGFSPQRLDVLDPPPPRPQGEGSAPPARVGGPASVAPKK